MLGSIVAPRYLGMFQSLEKIRVGQSLVCTVAYSKRGKKGQALKPGQGLCGLITVAFNKQRVETASWRHTYCLVFMKGPLPSLVIGFLT